MEHEFCGHVSCDPSGRGLDEWQRKDQVGDAVWLMSSVGRGGREYSRITIIMTSSYIAHWLVLWSIRRLRTKAIDS